MLQIILWEPIEVFLWGSAITILFMGAGLYIYRGKQREFLREKVNLYGFASYFLGSAISGTFTIIYIIQIPGTFNNLVIYGDFDYIMSDPLLALLINISISSILIGTSGFIFGFEFIVKRTKYLLSITEFIFAILILFMPLGLSLNIFGLISTLNPIIILIILYYYTKWSNPEFKTVSLFFVFGFVMFFFAAFFNNAEIRTLNLFSLGLRPLLEIVGVFISILPTILNPKYFSRNTIIILIFSIIHSIISVLLLYFLVLYSLFSLLFSLITSYIISVLFYYFIYKGIKSEELLERKGKHSDILTVFVRPQKLTEDQISISKEKKVCLVCKTSLSKQIYLCSNCGAFYCLKCSEALINLENACWVCNTPFDENKPSNPFKSVEEKPSRIDEEFQKNNSYLEK